MGRLSQRVMQLAGMTRCHRAPTGAVDLVKEAHMEGLVTIVGVALVAGVVAWRAVVAERRRALHREVIARLHQPSRQMTARRIVAPTDREAA